MIAKLTSPRIPTPVANIDPTISKEEKELGVYVWFCSMHGCRSLFYCLDDQKFDDAGHMLTFQRMRYCY
jgi:hypothetical protein